jgi:Taurine catabolism dioxygenase TauD, TfdA family
MIRRDPLGGRSLLRTVDSVLERLSSQTREALAEQVYPFGRHCFPVLGPGRSIRYYRAQINERELLNRPSQYVAAIGQLDSELAKLESATCMDLQPGEALFVDNRTCLHGRTQITPSSDRLLYRFKIAAPDALSSLG